MPFKEWSGPNRSGFSTVLLSGFSTVLLAYTVFIAVFLTVQPFENQGCDSPTLKCDSRGLLNLSPDI